MRRARWLFSCIMAILYCQELTAQSNIRIYEDFRNTPLAEAFRSLEEAYGLEFNYADDQVRNKVIYVKIDNRPPTEAVDLLLSGTDLRWQYIEERGVFLIGMNSSTMTTPPEPEGVLIQGRVVDWENGEGLMAGIRDFNTQRGTLADIEGRFELFIEQGGESIILEVRHLGYQDAQLTIHPKGSRHEVEILLQALPVEIDGVIIESQQEPPVALAPGTQQIKIRPQKFGAVSGLGENDMMRTLQLLPGVNGVEESASQLNIRGGNPEHNLLLFDGITMYQQGHFFGMVGSFNSEVVEEVQLQRGGFGARYGGRLSSVIEVKTKPQKPDSLRAGFGMNALNGQVVLEVPFAKSGKEYRAAVLLAARRSTTDLFQSWLYDKVFDQVFQQGVIFENNRRSKQALPSNLRTNPRFHFGDVNARVIFQPNDKDHLSLSLFGGNDHLAYQSTMPVGNGLWMNDLDQLSLSNIGASATWTRQWSDQLYSESNVAYSSFIQDYSYLSETADEDSNGLALNLFEKSTIRDLTARQHVQWKAHDYHIIEGGIQYNHLNTRKDLGLYEYNWNMNDSLELRNDQIQDSAYLFHSYAQYSYQPETPLSFVAGLRHTYFSLTDQHYLAPRVSLKFELSDRWMLKAAFGQYRQFINRIDVPNQLRVGEDFWMLADGDSIPVAKAQHLITGIAYQTRDFLFDLEIYHKELSDLTTYTQSYFAGEGQLRNGFLINEGTGTARGLDVLVKKTYSIPGGTLTSLMSYSLSKVMYSFPEVDASRPFFADHDQRHSVKLANTVNLGRWNFGTTWTYASGRPYTPATGVQDRDSYSHNRSNVLLTFGERNSERLPAYHRLDISGAYKFSFLSGRRQANIGFSVFNVYNRKTSRVGILLGYLPQTIVKTKYN